MWGAGLFTAGSRVVHTGVMSDDSQVEGPAMCTCAWEWDPDTGVRERQFDPDCPLHRRHRTPETRGAAARPGSITVSTDGPATIADGYPQ